MSNVLSPINGPEVRTHQIALGRSTEVQNPQANVAQFQALLSNTGQALKAGAPGLAVKEPEDQKPLEGSLLEETALSVSSAQKSLDVLQRNVDARTHELKIEMGLNSDFTRAIVNQKYATAHLFVAITKVSNKGQHISEEMSSLTKGR